MQEAENGHFFAWFFWGCRFFWKVCTSDVDMEDVCSGAGSGDGSGLMHRRCQKSADVEGVRAKAGQRGRTMAGVWRRRNKEDRWESNRRGGLKTNVAGRERALYSAGAPTSIDATEQVRAIYRHLMGGGDVGDYEDMDEYYGHGYDDDDDGDDDGDYVDGDDDDDDDEDDDDAGWCDYSQNKHLERKAIETLQAATLEAQQLSSRKSDHMICVMEYLHVAKETLHHGMYITDDIWHAIVDLLNMVVIQVGECGIEWSVDVGDMYLSLLRDVVAGWEEEEEEEYGVAGTACGAGSGCGAETASSSRGSAASRVLVPAETLARWILHSPDVLQEAVFDVMCECREGAVWEQLWQSHAIEACLDVARAVSPAKVAFHALNPVRAALAHMKPRVCVQGAERVLRGCRAICDAHAGHFAGSDVLAIVCMVADMAHEDPRIVQAMVDHGFLAMCVTLLRDTSSASVKTVMKRQHVCHAVRVLCACVDVFHSPAVASPEVAEGLRALWRHLVDLDTGGALAQVLAVHELAVHERAFPFRSLMALAMWLVFDGEGDIALATGGGTALAKAVCEHAVDYPTAITPFVVRLLRHVAERGGEDPYQAWNLPFATALLLKACVLSESGDDIVDAFACARVAVPAFGTAVSAASKTLLCQ